MNRRAKKYLNCTRHASSVVIIIIIIIVVVVVEINVANSIKFVLKFLFFSLTFGLAALSLHSFVSCFTPEEERKKYLGRQFKVVVGNLFN